MTKSTIQNTDIDPPADPWALFREWYARAEKSEPSDPNAMALATVGADGMPSVRMVLFKGYGEDGFMFLTNRESVKGEHLQRHPHAAICLHWKSIQRQVRAEGPVRLISDAESDAYFATRPRESRIGAWVSQQSRALDSRAALDRLVEDYEKKFEGKDVPRPSYWGGYRLTPLRIEFWTEGRYRLHDRILYRRAREKEPWIRERLYP
jgi:pyridoxamine 5'-phosphate oxidase